MKPFENLYAVFQHACGRHGDRFALSVSGTQYSYRQLDALAGGIAAAVVAARATAPVTALLAYRSVNAYASILGILAARSGYVPLHPRFPVPRTLRMLELSQASVLVVAPEGVAVLRELLGAVRKPLHVVCSFDDATRVQLAADHRDHTFVSAGAAVAPATTGASADAVAYLLFTSGSTGEPKGVPVRHANVLSYLDYAVPRFAPGPEGRSSQTFDLTFDLSVHDMFVTWASGGCLCVPTHTELMAPARFIKSQALTHWFSVPSLVTLMTRMRLLTPGVFPSLESSLFCGEALLRSQAEAWQQAAPHSTIVNLYGPTEATIAITDYRWEPGLSEAQCANGVVPIGVPFPGQRVRVVDEEGVDREQGEGELWLGGSQVTAGYYNDEERTRERFVRGTTPEEVWYRTGDLVGRRGDGCLHFLGRLDQQVQIMGHRVELAEIEHVLREAGGTDEVVALAWPPKQGRADVVYALVGRGTQRPPDDMRTACAARLPAYMVPRDVLVVETWPLNVNGKVNRRALLDQLTDRLNG